MPFLIGIHGDIGSGKDTLASFMQEYAQENNRPCYNRGMAYALRKEVAQFLMTHLPKDHPAYNNFDTCMLLLTNRDTKEQFRGLMRWWGTEYRRQLFNENYWVQQHWSWATYVALLKPHTIILVPDVRYRNEADYITSKGGVVLEIFRPELLADKSHSSDIGLVDYKFFGTLLNDQGLEELKLAAWKILIELIDWKWGNAPGHTAL
jgi:hypothetical protein